MRFNALFALILLVSACGQPVYNSKDLAALPCEPASFYFLPIEFNKDGTPLFPDQLDALEKRLQDTNLGDVFLFVHGWNKTAAVAEQEYQDFICRFYWRGSLLQGAKPSPKEPNVTNSLIVGVFWPSTLLPNASDWTAIKFLSFYPIRSRADAVAMNGFQILLESMANGLKASNSARNKPAERPRLHLIGHSFGGRILVKGIDEKLLTKAKEMAELLDNFRFINLVLINAAIPSTAFRDPGQRFADIFMASFNATPEAIAKREYTNVATKMTSLSRVMVFNMYSRNDMATRYLFPFANMFTEEPIVCGLGACPAPQFPILFINDGGELEEIKIEAEDVAKNPTAYMSRVVNVDATEVITSHTDVFKGRIVNAIWALLRSDYAKLELNWGEIKKSE